MSGENGPLPSSRNGWMLSPAEKALVMGILNVTPDSFADGGRYFDTPFAVAQALRMEAEGAAIIDIGGESTRPGSLPVPPEEQCRRVLPVIRALREQSGIPVSIDTTRRRVAEAALDAGADMVNDISALREEPDMAQLLAERGAPVILMHMQGTPREMQKNPRYADVVEEVKAFLAERRESAVAAGIRRDAIVLDPGFGFGKTAAHNLTLLANLSRIVALGSPVLAGLSRKSTIGAVLDLPVEERLEGSLASAVLAVAEGARLVRAHDVRATVRAVRMAEAVVSHRAKKGDA
ncbi:MAG: dihydropteroate synthase [Planctomycetota bacterium]